MTMISKIREFLEWFPTITKEEAAFVEEITKWDEEKRAAFGFARRIFEEDEEDGALQQRGLPNKATPVEKKTTRKGHNR